MRMRGLMQLSTVRRLVFGISEELVHITIHLYIYNVHVSQYILEMCEII